MVYNGQKRSVQDYHAHATKWGAIAYAKGAGFEVHELLNNVRANREDMEPLYFTLVRVPRKLAGSTDGHSYYWERSDGQ